MPEQQIQPAQMLLFIVLHLSENLFLFVSGSLLALAVSPNTSGMFLLSCSGTQHKVRIPGEASSSCALR